MGDTNQTLRGAMEELAKQKEVLAQKIVLAMEHLKVGMPPAKGKEAGSAGETIGEFIAWVEQLEYELKCSTERMEIVLGQLERL